MPAITPGRSSKSQTGKIAGRRSKKLAPAPVRRREVAEKQRQTTAQIVRQRTAAAPANRRADAEKTRRDVLARSNTTRQLGLDARDKSPKQPTRTLILPSSRVTGPRTTTTSGEIPLVGAIKRQLGREEQGKGVVAALYKYAERKGLGGKLLTPPQLKGPAKHAAAIPGPDKIVKSKIVRNAGKDLYQFGPQAIPAAFQTGRAGVALGKGDTAPAKALLKDYDEHDAVWNAALAVGALSTGRLKEAQKRGKRAAKTFEEHPGLTLAEVFGTKGAAGRLINRGIEGTARVAEDTARLAEGAPGGNKVVRTAAKAVPKAAGKPARRVASRARKASSTQRAPAVVPGTRIAVQRKYSRDAIDRLAQRGWDKRKSRQAGEKRAQSALEDDPVEAHNLRRRANEIDPEVASDDDIARSVWEHIDASEQVRRVHRAQVDAAIGHIVKGAEKGGPIVPITTQRIVQADVDALAGYLDQIKEAGAKLPRSQVAKVAANRKLVAELSKAVSDARRGKVNLSRMQDLADAYATHSRASQVELGKRKLIDPHESERASAMPFAAYQLDARKAPKTLEAFAKVASEEAQKAKGKAQTAASKRRAVSARQQVQRANEPTNQLKLKLATGRARPDLPVRNRAESVTEYIKRIEDQALREEGQRGNIDADTLEGVYRFSDPETGARLTNVKIGGYDPTSIKDKDGKPARNPDGSRKMGEPRKFNVRADIVVDGEKIGEITRIYDRGKGALVKTRTQIKKEYQGKGIGTRLARAEEEALSGHGVGKVEVVPGTEAGKKLTAKLGGFEDVGEGRFAKELPAASPAKRGGIAGAVKREAERKRKADRAKANERIAKSDARGAKKTAAKAKKRARENPMVDRNDEPLSTDAIRAAMEERGIEPPAYITMAPGRRGRSNFYQTDTKPPNARGTGKRTEKATMQGVFDADPEVLREQAHRTQGLIDSFDSFKRGIDHMMLRDEKGDPATEKTFKDAAQVARDKTIETGHEWTPVRVNPLGGTQAQLDKILSDTRSETSVNDTLIGALMGEGEGGPWAVIPKRAADEWAASLKVLNPGDFARLNRSVTGFFRKTVLSTSPPWLLGNVGEGTLRAALNQAGPRSWATGRKVKAAGREAGDDLAAEIAEARTVGTGHYSWAERNQTFQNSEQYKKQGMRKLAKLLEQVFDAEVKGVPLPPKIVKVIWERWTHLVMQTVNKTMIEDQIQTAMLGKAIRNQRAGSGKRQMAVRPKPLMGQRAQDLAAKAADEEARGMLSEETASALGRELDRMYGQYGKFSPGLRSTIANYTPFIAWMKNAARFMYRLPIDHPTTTALVASSERAQQEWMKDQGLVMWMPNSMEEWLMGSIPDDEGGHYRAPTRYTPASVMVDPLGQGAGMVLPQYTGVLQAMRGKDWKGDDLKDENGNKIEGPAKFPKALGSFLDSTIPALAVGKRIKKYGAKEALITRGALQYAPRSNTKQGSKAKRPGSSLVGGGMTGRMVGGGGVGFK